MCAVRELDINEVCSNLAVKRNTLILFHTHPDGDAAGSAFALRSLLSEMGMRAYCVCSDELPKRLKFLAGDKQESVLVSSIPADFKPERIISVDTASVSQLGELYENFGGSIDFMIDHHIKTEPYADYCICPEASSCGEMIFEISRELARRGEIEKIPKEADMCIYAAISSDTGCFKYSNVTSQTHLCGAELVRTVNAAKVNNLLYGSKPYLIMKAEKAGFDRLNFYNDRRIAVITFPYDLKISLGLLDEHLETLVDVARVIEGVDAAVSIRQKTEDRVYRVSTRSQEGIDVSKVCSAFGGGGHIRAAGCTIEADSIETAEKMIVNEILKQYN